MAIDLTPLALRPVIRKHPVEPPDFFKSILGRPFEPAAVLAIQNQRIGRTHGLDAGFQPQILEAGAGRRENRQQKQNYHILFHLEGAFSSYPRVFLALCNSRSIRFSNSPPASASKCTSGTLRRLKRRATSCP